MDTVLDADPRLDARVAGTIGVGTAVGIGVVLGVHPWSSTSVYDDGAEFATHVSGFWIAIHLLGAALTLGIPVLVDAWAGRLDGAGARTVGRMATTIATLGCAVGVLHLIATDTIAIAFFEPSLQAGIDGGDAVADLLIRLHAGTLLAWTVGFWLALPAVVVAAEWMAGRRDWRVWLPAVGAMFALASIVVTLVEEQYTFTSDMLLFRPSVTALVLWVGLTGWRLRRVAS